MKQAFLSISWRWSAQVVMGAAGLITAAWMLGPAIRTFLQSSVVEEIDRPVAGWLHGVSGPTLSEFLLGVSWIHGTVGILVLAAILGAATWRYSNRSFPLVLIAAVPGGLLLNVAVKQAVMRPRPNWGYALQSLESYSFPSGHTAGAALFYGVVVAWLWPRLPSASAKVALLATAISLILLVATSRIVLGVHYLSDCMAAVVEAGLWLAICLSPAHGPATLLHEAPKP